MEPPSPLPKRFKLQLKDGIELSWRWKRHSVLVLLWLMCWCPPACGMYGVGLVRGMNVVDKNKSITTYEHNPWLGALLIAGAVLTVATFFYTILLNLLNRTTLRAGDEKLSVRHGPLPLPGVALRAGDISRVEARLSWLGQRMIKSTRGEAEFTEIRSSGQLLTGQYSVYAVDLQGKSHLLVSKLDTHEQSDWVVRELRRALGMPQPVEEES